MGRSLRLISPLDRAFHLKRLAALGHVPPAELAAIALRADEHSFARGATIHRPGERVEHVHVVVQGRVRVRGGEHGDEVLEAGQPIGLLSLLARDDAGVEATAETDTLTLALRAHDLVDVFEDDFGILYEQIRDLAEQTLRLRQWIPDGTYLAPAEDLVEPPSGDIDLLQRLLYMRRGALRNANMAALMTMAQRMRSERFERGVRLWEIGAPSGFLYVILGGRVRCTTGDGTHFVCGPGYPLGNLESQCGAPRWFEAVTETEVTVLRGETDVFLDTMEQHFTMAIDFVAAMAAGLIARRAERRGETGVRNGGGDEKSSSVLR